MKSSVLILSALISATSLVYAQPDTLWTRTYGGTDDDHGEAIQHTFDGGYILVGDAIPSGSGDRDVWLIKTDSDGQELWSHMFGGGGDDKGFSVQPTIDGGYIVTAATNSFGNGDYDFWLIKTDSLGQEQWNRTFGGSSPDYARSVLETIGGGYIITGRTASFGGGGDDIWLVKTDSLGNEEWNQTYGGSEHEVGYSVLQSHDQGYVIAGRTSSLGNGNYDMWLLKTDSLGNEEWAETFGGSNWESAFSIQATTDGGYIVVGGTNSFGIGGDDVWLIKTNSQGQEEWNQTFGGSEWETGFSVKENIDRGFIIAGGTTTFGAGDRDVWLVKTDSIGQEIWNQTYGGDFYDVGNSVLQTTEGGYIIAGSTLSFGNGGWDAWLISLASEPQPYSGPIWHISTTGSDSNDGSAELPFASIQMGIDVSVDGDTVLVQPGTYVENINFNGKNIVVGSLFLTTQDTSYISQTIIDGNQSGSCVQFISGETSSAVLDGFTITNGNGTIVNGSQRFGGGIYSYNSSNPTIQNCIITGNSAGGGSGGGISCWYASATIKNCIIRNNSNHGISNAFGAGVSVDNCIINNNYGSDYGGGISAGGGSSPIIINCTIVNNDSYHHTSTGIYAISGGTVINSIVRDNIGSDVSIIQGTTSVTYSNIEGGFAGTGNIDTNPLFVDASNHDYHLSDDSPCIGAGLDTAIVPNTDIDGNPRPNPAGSNPDMGAYENSLAEPLLHTSIHVPYDYSTIPEAVEAANDGDTVVVHPGVYSDPIAINDKSIVLIGASGPDSTVITTHMLHLLNTESLVDGFTIQEMERGLQVWGISNAEIRNCRFLNIDQEALKVLGDSRVLFENIFVDSARHGFNISDNGNAVIANSTVIDCYEANFVVRDGASAMIMNSIVYGGPLAIHWWTNNPIDSVTVYNSMIESGWIGPGSGNIDVDPRFENYSQGNVNLSDESFCIGAGIDSVYYQGNYFHAPDYDLAGVTRPTPVGSLPDIGAYENILAEPIPFVEIHNLDIGNAQELQHLIDHNPEISFSYSNSFSEPLTHHQIQVSSFSDFSEIDLWDTDTVASADTLVMYEGNTFDDGEEYFLRVKLGSGEYWSDWSELSFRMNTEPTAPVMLSPVSNMISNLPVILLVENGTDAEDDTLTYSFKLWEDQELESQVDSISGVQEDTENTSWQVMAELEDNNQYWWTASVNDGFEESPVSGPESFLLNSVNDSPQAFDLISPSEAEQVQMLSPLFIWEEAVDPDPLDFVSYTLYLDTPEAGVQTYEIEADTSFQLAIELIDNTTYFWKIVASDLYGASTENTGGYQSFIINTENDDPTDFSLIMPPNGAMVPTLTPEFYWESSTDPDDDIMPREIKRGRLGQQIDEPSTQREVIGYDLYVGVDPELTAVEPLWVEGNSYTPVDNLTENQLYWWCVIAHDDSGGSTYSDTSMFWTNSANDLPGDFYLEQPFGQPYVVVETPNPLFVWTPSSDPDINDEIVYHLLLGQTIDDIQEVYTGSDTTWMPMLELWDNTFYYWQVQAEDLSGAITVSIAGNIEGFATFVVNLGNDDPSVVELISPDSVMILTLNPEMYWTPATDPDPNDSIHYEMHWWGDDIELDSLLTDTNAVILPRELQDNTQYYWDVITMDNSDGISHSLEATFWTDLIPQQPLAFALLSPEDDETGLSQTPTFHWEPAGDPDPFDYAMYTIQLATDSSFISNYYEANTWTDIGHVVPEDLLIDTEYWWRVVATDTDSLTTESETFKFTVGYVSITEEIALPTEYVLEQNFPNPFNPSTTLRYGLPEDSEVSLIIYDIRGNTVKTFVAESQVSGWYEHTWNGLDESGLPVSTGLYLAKLRAESHSKTIKMVYLR
ncbi:T9SS type A sorting domain-containing protein [bacterium]|nr:T9SS type A sorting domain-containing protein [bacterium]